MSERPIDKVLAALRARGIEPKRAGGGWSARCPAHVDRAPSLSITEGSDGRVLLHCHAGCETSAIVAAIGLKLADLFVPGESRRSRHVNAPARVVDNGQAWRTFASARAAVAALERRHGKRAALWKYHRADGEPVMVVVRFNLASGKTLRPVGRLPSGEWIIGDQPGPLPLYNLPELLKAERGTRIYVAEGEKCCDAMRQLGLLATTSPHGSRSAAKADWSPLAGQDVVLIPDRDPAGERYAHEVAALLHALNPRPVVRIVRLWENWPDLPPGGDVADVVEYSRARAVDWARAHGGTEEQAFADELSRARECIEALADEAKPVEPEADAAAAARERPSIAGYKAFPTSALPDVPRRFVEGTATRMGIDPCFIASPALAVLASAVGNAVRVVVRKNWIEPCAIWSGVVALPSSMKSPAQEAALRPVYNAQREADADYDGKMEEYEAKMAEYENAKRERGKDRADAPERPKKPLRRQVIVSNATPEALAHVLAFNPRGALSEHDELAGLYGSFGQYSKSGANRAEPGAAFYKSAWSGRSYFENRKADGGSYIRIDSPLLSITGGIQPEALRRVLGFQYIEDGLASRFLWAMPPDDPARIIEEREDEDDGGAEYGQVYMRLLALPLRVDKGKPEPMYLGLQRNAFHVGREWWNGEMLPRVRVADPALRSALGKLKGYLFRFALLFHLVEWASRGEADAPGPVGVETMRRAIVLADWYAGELGRVYGMLAEDDEDRERRELADWIRRRGGTATPSEVAHGPRRYRGDLEGSERALRDLEAVGRGRCENVPSGPKGGRPTLRFRLYVGGTGTETHENQAENWGCSSSTTPAGVPSADADGCSDGSEDQPPDAKEGHMPESGPLQHHNTTDVTPHGASADGGYGVGVAGVAPEGELPGCPDEGELPGCPYDGDLGAFCSDMPEGVES